MSRYRRIIAIGSFVASLTPLTAVAAMPVGSGQPNPVTVNTGSTASSDALIQVRGRHTSSHRPVWIPGYWRWDGRRHIWVAGRWSHPSYRGHPPSRYGYSPPGRFGEPRAGRFDSPRRHYRSPPRRFGSPHRGSRWSPPSHRRY